MEVTFDIDEQTKKEFDEIVNELDKKYGDEEPFDKNEWLESKMKKFIKKQQEFLGLMGYNNA